MLSYTGSIVKQEVMISLRRVQVYGGICVTNIGIPEIEVPKNLSVSLLSNCYPKLLYGIGNIPLSNEFSPDLSP